MRTDNLGSKNWKNCYSYQYHIKPKENELHSIQMLYFEPLFLSCSDSSFYYQFFSIEAEGREQIKGGI
uniref:Uncharacterized protein n=1 Tax=Cucumis melo TaxID=3656 RepID=A0A9I9CCD9_CUCME